MIGLKRTLLLVAGLTGIVGLQAQAKAQVTQVSPGVYKFQMKYVKGQKFVYQMTSSTTMVGMPAAQMQMMGGGNQYAVKTTMTIEVLDVKNGVATLRNTTGAMTMNGKPMPMGGGKSTSSTMKVKVGSGQPVGGNGNVLGQLGLPDHPLKVGETFTTKNAVQTPGMPMNMNSTSKFLGVKTVNGRQVAQINSNVKMNGRMSGITNGVSLVDMADGQMISTTMIADMTMSLDGFGPKGGKGAAPGMKPMHMKQTTTIARK